MDTRKIIAFGSSSHVVSLPKEWMTSNNLKKGDSIYMDFKNNEISFHVDNKDSIKDEEKEITIIANGKKLSLLNAEIVSAYLTNYDIIRIKFDGKTEKGTEIKQTLRNLSGMEIINETANSILAKDLLNKSEISIKILVRRIDNIVRSMIEDSMQELGRNNYCYLTERDKDVNRLVYLAIRLIRAAICNPSLAKIYEMNNLELLYTYTLVTRLEKVADHIKRITRYSGSLTKTSSSYDEITDAYKNLQKCYLDSMKAYHTRDLVSAFKLEDDAKTRIHQISELKLTNNVDIGKMIEHIKALSMEIRNISRCIVGVSN